MIRFAKDVADFLTEAWPAILLAALVVSPYVIGANVVAHFIIKFW